MPHKDPEVRRTYQREQQRRIRAASYAAKKQAEAEAFALRPRWPVADLNWAAGLFEGEGTVTITKGGRTSHARCVATMTNTDRQVVQFFLDRWPGPLRVVHPKGNARPAWVWLVQGPMLAAFIADISPHLRTERVRAKMKLVGAAHALRRQGSRDPFYRATMERYRLEVKALNRRGRGDHDDDPGSSAGMVPVP